MLGIVNFMYMKPKNILRDNHIKSYNYKIIRKLSNIIKSCMSYPPFIIINKIQNMFINKKGMVAMFLIFKV